MSNEPNLTGQRLYLTEEDRVSQEELRLLKETHSVSVSSLPPRSARHGSKSKKQASAERSAGVFAVFDDSKRNQEPLDRKPFNQQMRFEQSRKEVHKEDTQEVSDDQITVHKQNETKLKQVMTRILYYVIGAPVFAAIVFWAKFALVYNIPDFVKTSPVADGAYAYICYKSWTFGPPMFSLKDNLSTAGKQDLNGLNTSLGDYKEIVEKPIWVVYRFKKQ